MTKFFSKINWRAFLAEFFGTFVFVFVSSLAAFSSHLNADIGTVGVALATGLSLGVMVFACVSISGGHLNPAVTLALWFSQKIDTVSAFFYIFFQILASFAAAAVLLSLFSAKGVEFALGGPMLGDAVSVQTALILEAILSTVLVFVVYATMVDKRGPLSFGPLIVGLTVVVCAIAAGPISGAALNPARAIGPIVLSGKVGSLAVWLIGPLVGSLFGPVYEFLFLRKSTKSSK